MQTSSLEALRERTGAGARKAVELGAITERGKPLVRLEAAADVKPIDPNRISPTTAGIRALGGTLGRVTDSAAIIFQARERASPS